MTTCPICQGTGLLYLHTPGVIPTLPSVCPNCKPKGRLLKALPSHNVSAAEAVALLKESES